MGTTPARYRGLYGYPAFTGSNANARKAHRVKRSLGRTIRFLTIRGVIVRLQDLTLVLLRTLGRERGVT